MKKETAMDFYKFINSKAVREHLRKINWSIEPDAAAWLIWHWEGPIEEKLSGWKYIIDETEDRELRGRLDPDETSSLHGFLKKTIDIYKKNTDSLNKSKNESWINIEAVFMNQWFYFPISFKKGDIVRIISLPELEPMVYVDSIYDSRAFRKYTEDFYNGKRGDLTDMIINVYRVSDELELYSDTLWPVTDFDYFSEEDAKTYANSNPDHYKMTLLIRAALKDKLGLEILFSGYKQLINKSSVGSDYASYIFSKAERLVD